ncbi:tRNA adenosine(34) deaminase TadA [Pseudomaricurvus alkylphenolicus]|uniref:tRNA adenosine(34) deaminase TadA n=1 Tax=Pseudomaricurvus alkylphenolicus TaxID=1306991 RepID=UPI00142122EC|nr:tRNA adenosine(34) deaminase TadA [Pseudomaricurvus alkylphenolicus]NIB43997.1 tRNA adenosine(34) deaminase TadA [Pseudomaricurvus alkylphenolicus]
MTPPDVKDDTYWMERALDLAARAESLGEVPVGALVVLDGEIIGEGWNQPISGCDPTAHAEIIALRAAARHQNNYRLPGAFLYVTIEPCTMCAGAIIHSRIERVVFAATEPKAGAVVSNGNLFEQPQFNHQVEYVGGVLAEKASEGIQAFFKRRREELKVARKAAKSEGQNE